MSEERESASGADDPAAAARDTVLVVEDYEDIRHMLSSALALRGFRVVEAANGWAAIDAAARERPRLILMDLQMPTLDGFEATQLLREHDELRDVPIIAVSAHSTDDDRADALDAGFTAFLTKPIDFEELYRVIHTYLPEEKNTH